MNMNWSGGDWMCGVCEHVNFKKREACQRCGYPKYGGPDPSAYDQYIHSKTDEVLAGDWYCNCGAHNYASRSTCYRCNAYKTLDVGALPGWKSGDWICTRIGCETHNYASRMECYKCKAPRDFGGAV
ncbi:zinc finger Ran-binding domain-containing protein 2-like [Benincasa hispida]|uniref:zinc finger Ran-binding domain-containing protein 2-like n=1 Tax=Benincasa hispida TaxID=102211 RepID=UPI0018FFAF30|nr:zinc finger Ran-binding domain-containing protein 2-like [Benincasa hispida]